MYKKKYLVSVLLIVSLLLIMVTCKTSRSVNINNSPQLLPEQEFLFQEDVFPLHPFFESANTNMYIKNRGIIEQFAKIFGIDSPFIVALIVDIRASLIQEGFSLVIKVEDTSFKQKQKLMKKLEAYSLDEDARYWHYINEDEKIIAFDIGFEDAIVVTNLDITKVPTLWAWNTPALLLAPQNAGKAHAWVWSRTRQFVSQFEVKNYRVDWATMIITDYQQSKDMRVTFAIDYKGDRSTRTTIKLLFPLLLKSIGGVDAIASLPEVQFIDDVLIIEHLLIHTNEFLKTIQQLTQ